MRIGIISDTHGILPAWYKAMEVFKNTDLILHAGDVLYHPPRIAPSDGYDIPGLVEQINSCPVPIVIARGNCDPEVYSELLETPSLSPYALVQLDNLRILVHHGHSLQNKDIKQILQKQKKISIVVSGHTHIPLIESTNGVIYVNPGSPSHPKLEHESVLVPTVGLVEDNKISIIDLNSGKTIFASHIV
jgi:putative phosphoesterase